MMQNESIGRTEKWPLPLPFLTTHPLTDIGLLFLLLPLWWALGLDQFIWPPLVLFLFLKTLTCLAKQRRSLRLPLIINPMLFFLVIYGVSGIFIVEKDRYLLFLYQYIGYISAALLFILTVTWIVKKRDLSNLVWTLFITMLLTSIIGILGALGWLSWVSFSAPIRHLLPSFVRESQFAAPILNKSVIHTAYFAGIQYNRVRSFFLYANNYAQALVTVIPLSLFLLCSFRSPRNPQKLLSLFLIAGISLMVTNLLFTTSRSALLGLVIGGLWWLFFWQRWPLKSYRNLNLMIAGVLAIVLMIAILQPEIKSLLYARPGSFGTRWIIWTKTLASWKERPILGWGTSRVIWAVFPEFTVRKHFPPLGSHSTYLGFLYKQGIVGLLAYFWILWSIIKEIRRSHRLRKMNSELYQFIGLATWGFIATTIQGISNMLDLDLLSLHFTWINWALIIGAGRILRYQTDNGSF